MLNIPHQQNFHHSSSSTHFVLFYITFADFKYKKKIECFMSYWHLPQSYVFIRIPIYIQKCSFFNFIREKNFFCGDEKLLFAAFSSSIDEINIGFCMACHKRRELWLIYLNSLNYSDIFWGVLSGVARVFCSSGEIENSKSPYKKLFNIFQLHLHDSGVIR